MFCFKKKILFLVLVSFSLGLFCARDLSAMNGRKRKRDGDIPKKEQPKNKNKKTGNTEKEKKSSVKIRFIDEYFNQENNSYSRLRDAKKVYNAAFDCSDDSEWDGICEEVEGDDGETGEYFFHSVLDEKDNIIGFVLGIDRAKSNDEEYRQDIYKMFGTNNVAHVMFMAVDPTCQKRGVGTDLIYSIFKKISKTDVIYLYPTDGSRGFYEHIGFVENSKKLILTRQKLKTADGVIDAIGC